MPRYAPQIKELRQHLNAIAYHALEAQLPRHGEWHSANRIAVIAEQLAAIERALAAAYEMHDSIRAAYAATADTTTTQTQTQTTQE